MYYSADNNVRITVDWPVLCDSGPGFNNWLLHVGDARLCMCISFGDTMVLSVSGLYIISYISSRCTRYTNLIRVSTIMVEGEDCIASCEMEPTESLFEMKESHWQPKVEMNLCSRASKTGHTRNILPTNHSQKFCCVVQWILLFVVSRMYTHTHTHTHTHCKKLVRCTFSNYVWNQ